MSSDVEALRSSVKLLTLELSGRMFFTDWDSSGEVQHADRLMRVLSAYGRNIEKCIAMTEGIKTCETTTRDDDAEVERLRHTLYDQLVRYADRLGEEELARRLAQDIADAGTERVEILGPEGSVSS